MLLDKKKQEKKDDSSMGGAYIIRVDVPRHVSVRNKLSINIASDFAVPPTAVDVNDTDHVPLQRKSNGEQVTSLQVC